MRPYSSVKAFCGLSFIPVSQVLGYLGNLGRLDPNTLNYVQGYMKSNPKSSTLYFTSNEILLWCQGFLWVELYFFISTRVLE